MNNKDIRTIMVTGAGGFLGGELLNKLYNNTNYNIVGITSKKEDIYRKYKNQNILVCYNIEGWEKEKIPWNSIDLIVHCAFSRSYDGFSLAKAIKFTKDLFMTAKINCVKGIINISSQSVYGNKSKPLWNEDTPVSPDSTYAMAKYATEILTHTICNQKTMIGTNIRLDSLLGPGLDARLVSRFVNQVIKHEPIKIIGGMQKLSFLDVRDASEGLISLISTDMQNWKNTYNLGNEFRYSICQIADLVKQIAIKYTSVPVAIEIENRDVHLDLGMNSSIFYRDTGWRPRYNMESIVESLFDYFITKHKSTIHGDINCT